MPETCESRNRRSRWNWKARETRLLLYLLVVVGVAVWKYLPRPWHPVLTAETTHYVIYSSATGEATDRTAQALESLYGAYSNRFGSLKDFRRTHDRLKVKLFKDRSEFRRVNPGLGWVEAFYREPWCQAYFSAEEYNPYHWMLHEAVHQLNREVAGLKLAKWLEEGLATYFSTSRLEAGQLDPGRVDRNTYPIWWMDQLATGTDLAADVRNGSVIPLRAIITNTGGPSLDRAFNLYYLHWWTLTHFLFQSASHREGALRLVEQGGELEAFEQLIGPVEQVEREWHAYVRQLKTRLEGGFRERGRTAATNNASPPGGD